MAYALRHETVVDDSLLGMLFGTLAFVGLAGALGAFVLALVATLKRDRAVGLWLPLSLFPTFVLFLALGEAFWWE